jgi:tetratricopeptide (TPR) repeat protein
MNDSRRAGVFKMIVTAVGATAIAVVLMIVPTLTWLIPRSVRRPVIDAFLMGMLVAHAVVWAYATVGTIVLAIIVIRSRKRFMSENRSSRRRSIVLGLFVLAVSCLPALFALEGAARLWWNYLYGTPTHPYVPELPSKLPAAEPGSIRLLVLGESSAEGEPYQNWLSVGQIVAWKLEQAIPGLKVETDIQAWGGASMKSIHYKLMDIKKKPNLVIIYAGHNEFQAIYSWDRSTPIGDDDPIEFRREPIRFLAELSPMRALILDVLRENSVDRPPPPFPARALVDLPNHRKTEYVRFLNEFHDRLDALVSTFERVGAKVVLIIPCSNDAGFEPSRSVPNRPLAPAERLELETALKAARAAESDPDRAIKMYQDILAKQPTFAEARYRSAKMYETKKDFAAARREYVEARNDDGQILRATTDFQNAYRDIAKKHDVILIDGQGEFEAIAPHGILDDHLFHDGQHPNVVGYSRLAQATLAALRDRRAFGLNEGEAPTVDPADVLAHFDINTERWIEICRRTALFWVRVAPIRFDPTERNAKAHAYAKAAEKIKHGVKPEDAGVIGLGVPRESVENRRRRTEDREEKTR